MRKKPRSSSKDTDEVKWTHPGGKLLEMGSEKLSDAELLSIIIAPGIKGRSALEIAEEIILKYGNLQGLANLPLERLLDFRGISDVKIIRIAAVFEIAQRLVQGQSNG